MQKIQKFNSSKIKYIIFDVDGTLYRKDIEYKKGVSSIQTAQDFFRFLAFDQLSKKNSLHEEISRNLISEYKKRTINNTIEKAIENISDEKKDTYKKLVKKYGSNGKVFVGEFKTNSKYLHEMLKHINFNSILENDKNLLNTFTYLKNKNYKLGILTTEVYQTVDIVSKKLGFNIKDFWMETNDKYKILCAENVKQKKPSLEGFKKLLQIFNVSNPEEIVYVGDNYKKDIEAPLKCGLQAIHIINSGTNSIKTTLINGIKKEYFEINNIYSLKNIL